MKNLAYSLYNSKNIKPVQKLQRLYTFVYFLLGYNCFEVLFYKERKMKKILGTMAVLSVVCLAGTAHAVDSSGGCGLGSMAWRGQSGVIPQSLAITTNSWFSNTIGVTMGTSGCDPNGRVTGGTGRMTLAFLQDNMEQFAMDAAAGRGETIETLAGILNVDSETLGQEVQQNFAYIFPNDNVEAADVALKVMEIAKA